ncbi:MAG: DUF4114 domain-containing protein [Cyanobacteria bacterium P01_A01_bin.68]
MFNSSEDSFDAGNPIDSIFNINPFPQNASDLSTTLNINNYFQGSNLSPVIDDEIINVEPQNDRINAPFTFGFYTVGDTGKVNFDYLLNGGAYQGELGIFSLTGLGKYEIGSDDFVREAARLALSNSASGYVVISEQTEGARYKTEDADSGSEYKGIKTFEMNRGDQFGIILVPDGTLEEVFENPRIGGSKQPIFSLAPMNPQQAFHIGQVKDMTGGGSIWAMEDLSSDRNSDRDFNDFVFYLEGAVGNAHSFDTLVNPARDWRSEDVGRNLLEDESIGKLSIPQPDLNPTTVISVEEITNPDNNHTSRIFVKGENIRILGNSNTQDLEFYIGDKRVESTVNYREEGDFEANLNIPDGIDLGEYEVKVVAKDREGKDIVTQPYLIEVINGGENYLPVTHEGDSFNVGLHTVDNQDFAATDKDIWIIVHGWNNNSSNWLDFAETVDGYSDNDLVLLLDWGEGAQTGTGNLLIDGLNQAQARIDTTATGIAKVINDKLGVSSRSRINLIGHSLGAYVSGEIAQRMGGIDKLILLDPANQSLSKYNDDVNFSEVSNFSRAFYSSALGDSAIDADESYLIIQDDFIDDSINYAQDLLFGLPDTIEGEFPLEKLHGLPKSLYSKILTNQDNLISQLFGLEDDILSKDLKSNSFSIDSAFDLPDIIAENLLENVFEGIIYTDSEGNPKELRYQTNEDYWVINETEKSVLLDFELENQSLWGQNEAPNFGINLGDTLNLIDNINFGVGTVSSGFDYQLEAFLSGGDFSTNIPSLFAIEYPEEVNSNSSATIKFKPKLSPRDKASLETQLGTSFLGAANLLIDLEPFIPLPFETEIKLGSELNGIQSIFETLGSPVIIGTGLTSKTDEIDLDNNKFIAEGDTDLIEVDVVNAFALALKLSGVATPFAALIEATRQLIERSGIEVTLGGKAKQEAILEIKGFEIDFDGEDNGNEVEVNLNEWAELEIPVPDSYNLGDTYKFTPTVKPLVNFTNDFSFAGEAGASFDLRNVFPLLPNWLNDTDLSSSVTSPYTPPISFSEVFNPFEIAGLSLNLPEVSFKIK